MLCTPPALILSQDQTLMKNMFTTYIVVLSLFHKNFFDSSSFSFTLIINQCVIYLIVLFKRINLDKLSITYLKFFDRLIMFCFYIIIDIKFHCRCFLNIWFSAILIESTFIVYHLIFILSNLFVSFLQ